MAYIVMAYIVMAYAVLALCSFGLHSYGVCSYGVRSYGMCSFGLCSFGLNKNEHRKSAANMHAALFATFPSLLKYFKACRRPHRTEAVGVGKKVSGEASEKRCRARRRKKGVGRGVGKKVSAEASEKGVWRGVGKKVSRRVCRHLPIETGSSAVTVGIFKK